MYSEAQLLALARAYEAHCGLGLDGIGRAFGYHNLLGRLDSGKSCTLKIAARAGRWFEDNWPEDLTWPPDVPRAPSTSPPMRSEQPQ